MDPDVWIEGIQTSPTGSGTLPLPVSTSTGDPSLRALRLRVAIEGNETHDFGVFTSEWLDPAGLVLETAPEPRSFRLVARDENDRPLPGAWLAVRPSFARAEDTTDGVDALVPIGFRGAFGETVTDDRGIAEVRFPRELDVRIRAEYEFDQVLDYDEAPEIERGFDGSTEVWTVRFTIDRRPISGAVVDRLGNPDPRAARSLRCVWLRDVETGRIRIPVPLDEFGGFCSPDAPVGEYEILGDGLQPIRARAGDENVALGSPAWRSLRIRLEDGAGQPATWTGRALAFLESDREGLAFDPTLGDRRRWLLRPGAESQRLEDLALPFERARIEIPGHAPVTVELDWSEGRDDLEITVPLR